jgi:hypothetical protein
MRPPANSALLLSATVLASAGCHHAHSPTVDVLGSYFPAWLICIVAGLLLTIATRQIFILLKLAGHLRPAPLVYLCLMLCFTLAVWLFFFQN